MNIRRDTRKLINIFIKNFSRISLCALKFKRLYDDRNERFEDNPAILRSIIRGLTFLDIFPFDNVEIKC